MRAPGTVPFDPGESGAVVSSLSLHYFTWDETALASKKRLLEGGKTTRRS